MLEQQIVGATSLNAFNNGLERPRWASSWIVPLSPRPLWLVVLLVRPYKVSYKVSYNESIHMCRSVYSSRVSQPQSSDRKSEEDSLSDVGPDARL